MAKKQWTDEERKAFGDKMKAARQNKNPQQKESIAVKTAEQIEQPEIKQGQTISTSEYVDLLRQIEELKSNQTLELVKALQANQPNTSVAGGRVVGTFEKYSTQKGKYPDPRERLSEEIKLQRFAFPMNYELNWEVGVSAYQTKEGINTKEPKFSLTLVRIMMDEDTGEPTNGRYEICRMVMHEDPEAALVVASDNNLDVEGENEEAFLNEMRYLRMRDWLIECFYPAPIKRQQNQREIVIDGKLVSYYEVNDEKSDGPKLDWSKMPRVKF